MGLKIHSLGELPAEASRGYFVYLLDYGWEEPLSRALRDNFDRMEEAASLNDAAVLLGAGTKFNYEDLSWHGVNGKSAGELLPAILITKKHPDEFRRMGGTWIPGRDYLVVLPLRDQCKTATDVASLIDSIFGDLKAKRPLANFAVAREEHAGLGGAILDAVVLRPSVGGIGIDLKVLLGKFGKKGRDGA